MKRETEAIVAAIRGAANVDQDKIKIELHQGVNDDTEYLMVWTGGKTDGDKRLEY